MSDIDLGGRFEGRGPGGDVVVRASSREGALVGLIWEYANATGRTKFNSRERENDDGSTSTFDGNVHIGDVVDVRQ